MSVELGDSYEAIYERAMNDLASGQVEQGIAALQRIVSRLVRLRPETIQRKPELQAILISTWDELIDYLYRGERWDEAIALCRQIADHLPGEHLAELRVGTLYIARGEVEKGLAHVHEIIERDPGFSPWYALGTQYMGLKRYQESAHAYRSALTYARDNNTAAAANLRLFEAYRELEQVDEALTAWNTAAVLNEGMPDQLAAVYRWLIERGDLEQAARYLRRETNPMRRTLYQGYLDQQAGRTGEARKQWRQVLDMDAHGQDADIAVWAEAALRLGEPQRAVDEGVSLDQHGHPMSDTARLMFGIAHAAVGDVEGARHWFDRALDVPQSALLRQNTFRAEYRPLYEASVTDPEIRQALISYWQE